jgi:hypothetical protein
MTADETYWRELAAEWMNAEEPSRSEHQWRKLLSSSRPGREAMMEPHVREFVAQLPERIRVWRGAVRGLNERGFSWALERGEAVLWAHRNADRNDDCVPVVVCGAVARADVIALLVERAEMEVLALPEHVDVEAIEDVSEETPPASTGAFKLWTALFARRSDR